MAFLFLAQGLRSIDAKCKISRRETAVIRITRTDESPSQVTLKVEGQIVSLSVSVLEQECLTSMQGNQKVVLDFSDVTFIDSQGMLMLKRIKRGNLKIINCSDLIDDCLKS